MAIRYVSKGVVSSGVVLSGYYGSYNTDLDLMTVLSGGTANYTRVNEDSILTISSGGTANYTTVDNWGEMEVSAGTVNHTIINSGTLRIHSGGTATSSTVNEYGDIKLYQGAVASNTTVTSGGEIHIKLLASAYRTTIKSGGIINGFTLHSSAYYASIVNGALNVENATVDYLEDAFVYSGGTANNTIVNSEGWLLIESKGIATRTEVNYFGCLQIKLGGTANSSIIHSSGSMFVRAGGSANNTIISSGGIMEVGTIYNYSEDYAEDINHPAGIANRTTVQNGGILFIGPKGTMNNTTVFAGGTINGFTLQNSTYYSSIVSGSFKVDNAIISNKAEIYSGLSANNITIISGASIHISSGGNLTKATILSGGIINGFTLQDSAYYDSIINGTLSVKNATVYEYAEIGSGLLTSDITISSRGSMCVFSGGTANRTVINSSASMHVSFGGMVNSTTINSSGNMKIFSNGIAKNTNVNGNLFVLSGGTATSSTIKFYGSIHISSGGEALNTSITSQGTMAVFDGGLVNNTNISSDGYASINGFANSTIVNNGGKIAISGGGSAYCTFISSGGNAYVYSEGTINKTTVSGRLTISSGGTASATTILAGGTINGFTLQSAAFYDMIENGVVNIENAIVYSRAYFFGGNAYNTTVRGNNIVEVFKGTITRLNIVTTGAVVYMHRGSTLNFDLTQGNTNSAVQVNNLNRVTGTPNYAITVSGNTKAGTYRLADGASNFNGTITIRNSSANLGSITVGSTLKIGSTSYTLNKKNGQLTLTVTGTTAAKTVKSDINGNGVSDVMFQYNADHQVGFWLDGKNNWQGQGLAEPAEWQVLGAYDMDSNGKADVVMVGNVTVNGVKGAYIGFRKDGDTSTWQNISYLTNYNNIEWKVKVGNITGNAGKNSIVWHAPELGALGIWADGTNQWVSITGWFDNSWHMLGTGDFDGDGKDEILLRNNNSLYTVNINNKFTSLGTASNWKVCAIGDFSGDGKDDLVLYHQQTGLVMKYENGQSSQWSTLGQLDAKDWFIVGAGDYDGDSKDDLLVRQYSTGMLGYYSGGDMNRWREMGRGVDMNWAVIA